MKTFSKIPVENLTLQKGTSPYFKVMKRRTDSLEIPFSSPNDHDQAPSYSWPFKTKVMLGRAWLCIRKNSPTQEIDSNSFSSDSNFTAAHSVICWQNEKCQNKNACCICKNFEEHCLSTVSNSRHGKCDRLICVFT